MFFWFYNDQLEGYERKINSELLFLREKFHVVYYRELHASASYHV